MQSWQRGWIFLRQSWHMLTQDADLIKPSLYALMAGVVLSVLTALPILWLTISLGQSGAGGLFWLLLAGLLAFIQYLVAYVFSAMTVYLIYGYLAEGDGRMDRAWEIARRDMWDLAALAAASALVATLRKLPFMRKNGVQKALSGLFKALWDESAALVLPVMVIEDLPLSQALVRVERTLGRSIPLVGLSMVGVAAITRALYGLAALLALLLGSGLTWFLVYITGGAWSGWALGIASGIAAFALLSMAAIVLATYTRTAYYTCLYLWAREAARARLPRYKALRQITPPPPLAAALEKIT